MPLPWGVFEVCVSASFVSLPDIKQSQGSEPDRPVPSGKSLHSLNCGKWRESLKRAVGRAHTEEPATANTQPLAPWDSPPTAVHPLAVSEGLGARTPEGVCP